LSIFCRTVVSVRHIRNKFATSPQQIERLYNKSETPQRAESN